MTLTWHWWWHHQMMTKVTFVNSFINTYPSLLQNFILIKSHIETWVWKSSETKLFTSKVLKKSWKVIIKKCDLNTAIPSQCLKINKLQNNVGRIKPNRMQVKSKNNHEEMQLEHPYFLTILKNRCKKNIWNANEVRFYTLFVQCRPAFHMYSHVLSTKKQFQCSKPPFPPD